MTKRQEDHRQRVEALCKTRQFFDMLILQGQPDPYRELFAIKKKLIVGHAESQLLAMVRISVAGGRSLYRCIANRTLFEDQDARELISF